jgi:uncharacterized protein YcaQ
VAAVRTISNQTARRLAVSAQLLAGPRPDGVLDTVRRLGRLQLDPTSVVARSHLLVLWSRLGAYDPAELDALLWDRRELFEYRAYVVPTAEYAYLKARMKAWPAGDSARRGQVRRWMDENDALRRSILSQLRRRGPLRLRDIEGTAAVGWRSTGWNDERNVGQMLDFLHAQGKVVVSGRESGHRIWDLAGRVLPADVRNVRPVRDPALVWAERLLLTRPVAAARDIPWLPGDPHPRELLPKLVRRGRAVPVDVAGLRGPRYVHGDHVDLLDRIEAGRWDEPRTTLLSPFDELIHDRARTEALFGFRYKLEIYVPKEKREYGYFVLPILHGDRLVGRIDSEYDRAKRKLRVNATSWEPGVSRDAKAAGQRAIAELEAFLQVARH